MRKTVVVAEHEKTNKLYHYLEIMAGPFVPLKNSFTISITHFFFDSISTSKEEQVAKWSHIIYDKNKNKVLERSEWKAFKDDTSVVKSLKRCGKKLPRYCDINKDRKISMTEWLECLNVQSGTYKKFYHGSAVL